MILQARPFLDNLPGEDLGGREAIDPAPRLRGDLLEGEKIIRALEDQEARFLKCPRPERPPLCFDGCGYLNDMGACICPEVRRPPAPHPTLGLGTPRILVNKGIEPNKGVV